MEGPVVEQRKLAPKSIKIMRAHFQRHRNGYNSIHLDKAMLLNTRFNKKRNTPRQPQPWV